MRQNVNIYLDKNRIPVDEDEDGIPDDPIPNRLEAPRKGGDTVPR